MMEHCVRTARQAGVFKEFHVLTDRALIGCDCYDAYQFEKTHGLFKLHYLKVGMSRLNFDFFVWLDADTVFVRQPLDLLAAVSRSPIHVPLEASLSALTEDRDCQGVSLFRLRDLFRQEGIVNQAFLCDSAFWIVHHDAIDTVYELALGFWHKAKEVGVMVDVSAALGYAMQILCADPEAHLLVRHPDIWASDDRGRFKNGVPDSGPWTWKHLLGGDGFTIRPAIIHLPHSKELLAVRANGSP